jgi:hypothetical protein
MKACELSDTPDVELYFYDELDEAGRARVAGHLRGCPTCRQRLDDLHAIRLALVDEPVVEAPPAGDWSGFMRRLDETVGVKAAGRRPPAVLERAGATWRVRLFVAVAATLAIIAMGAFMAARIRERRPDIVAHSLPASPGIVSPGSPTTPDPSGAKPEPSSATGAAAALTPAAALREVSAEHLERSKLVVLGLAARDPRTTRPSDWQYERKLAGSLLPDTRLYRLAAQERGAVDVAHVMRDLETVLLEASMSDSTDRESLARVQRLIARRGLVTRMQMVTTSAGL